jgi:outer membrane murein-binding lipoprotein Lpp
VSSRSAQASTACAKSARAPLRKTSVSGSLKVPGCESWTRRIHSFAGEVEALRIPVLAGAQSVEQCLQVHQAGRGEAARQKGGRWPRLDRDDPVAANSSNTIAHFAAGLFPLRERVWWSRPASLTACSYQRPSTFRVVAVRSCPGTRGWLQ